MEWFVVCASIYDMLKQTKKNSRKHLTTKQLWTFEWPIMNHDFISPYHNHFWVDFNFYFLNMYIKILFKIIVLQMGFLVH
jgi:hypothetical protein